MNQTAVSHVEGPGEVYTGDEKIGPQNAGHGSKEGGSGIPGACFNLSKTIIGAGIFTMPSALQEGGFFMSLVLIVALGVLSNWTVLLLIRTGIKSNVYDYRKLMLQTMGRWGSALYFLSAIIFAYGICAAYSIIAADTVPAVVHALSGLSYDELGKTDNQALRVFSDRRVVITLVSVFILFGLSSMKYLKNMVTSSFIGLVMFLWVVCSAIAISWTKLPAELHGSTKSSEVYTFVKWGGLPSVASRAAFAVVCHHNQFIILRSLKVPTYRNYRMTANISILISVLFGSIFGIIGYIPLVEKATGGNILNYLPRSDMWVQIAKIAFAIDVILTYPLELFVTRDILTDAIHKTTNVSKTIRYTYTALLVGGTLLVSVLMCELNSVVDFTGGVAASMIAFVMPPLASIIIKRRKGEFVPRKCILHFVSIIVGLSMVILTCVIILPGFSINVSNCSYRVL